MFEAMMDDFAVPAIVREGFTIAVKSGDGFWVTLSGNADMEMVPLLGPYLSQVHEYLCRVGARSVVVDIRNLYFLNSSCFKAIINWIAAIDRLDPSQKYDVKFVTNSRLNWQRRNLRSILDFAPTIVAVQER
jgi:hypothetical protein